MKLAGAELPNVTLDGFDMSPILFDSTPVSTHQVASAWLHDFTLTSLQFPE